MGSSSQFNPEWGAATRERTFWQQAFGVGSSKRSRGRRWGLRGSGEWSGQKLFNHSKAFRFYPKYNEEFSGWNNTTGSGCIHAFQSGMWMLRSQYKPLQGEIPLAKGQLSSCSTWGKGCYTKFRLSARSFTSANSYRSPWIEKDAARQQLAALKKGKTKFWAVSDSPLEVQAQQSCMGV